MPLGGSIKAIPLVHFASKNGPLLVSIILDKTRNLSLDLKMSRPGNKGEEGRSSSTYLGKFFIVVVGEGGTFTSDILSTRILPFRLGISKLRFVRGPESTIDAHHIR